MPMGTGAAGGLGALGVIIMPLGIAAMLLKQPPGPVKKLVKAGAISPETARRCETLDIPRPFVLEPAMRRGVVHRTEDGRYWVDLDRARRVRRRLALVAGLLAMALGAAAWAFLVLTAGDGVEP